MAKPIIVITVNKSLVDTEDCKSLQETLERRVNYEYHVIIAASKGAEFKMECFNDCKGLPDIDIEQLIKDYTNAKA